MKIKKQWVYIGLILILGIVIYLSSLSTEIQTNKEINVTYNYTLGSFWITFNEKVKDNLIAITAFNRTKENPSGEPNQKFIELLQDEISSTKIAGIENLNIKFYSTIDGVNIFIDYQPGITDYEKNITLYKLINIFKEKWYTLDSDVSLFGTRDIANNKSFEMVEGNKTIIQQPMNNITNVTDSIFINKSRFVDNITKIVDIWKEPIQKQLDEISYASIIITLDKRESIDFILLFLSTDEFKLEEKSQSSPIIAGNASKAAINKLETNPHVIKIYYNTGKTTTALQDTVSLIKAYLVWKLQISSLNITGENTTYS